jgi:hypothetical protein
MNNTHFLAIALAGLFSLSTAAAPTIHELQRTQHEVTPPVKQPVIKVALLLDTSNSMDGLIDQAKSQLWQIVNELSYARCRHEEPNLEIALYEYGNDNLAAGNGYIRKVLAFTPDLDDVSKELFSLRTNGGSEYCGTVITAALSELDWGNDADDLKMVFIAGNEPFTQGKIDYRDASLQAREKDIVVNTIFCGNHEQGIHTQWKDGADLAYGDYMSIDHNKETVHIATPYDDLILQLNIQLNGTYVPYGYRGQEKAEVQMAQDQNAQSSGKGSAVGRTVTKSSKFYKNSSWDLVDAVQEDAVELEELIEQEVSLPKELQGKSAREIEAYVELKLKERKKIQEEIAQLSEQRRTFILAQQKVNGNGLENAMIQALKKQGAKKNYNWD